MYTYKDTTICHEKGTSVTQPTTLPASLTSQNDIFTIGATHMAHIHNAILRGYNSIYLQAPHITDADKPAFVGYALTWYRFVKSHHDSEELELFPKVEAILGLHNIWEETHHEHRTPTLHYLPSLLADLHNQKAFYPASQTTKHTSPPCPPPPPSQPLPSSK
jgi:hypothetical protein